VPIGLTHLFYICFLSGITISATVFIALHYFFPASSVREFVQSAPPPAVLMTEYREQWDTQGGVEHLEEHPKP
jgi:NCS1 family nucleobase:cation symporter-1